MQLSLLNRSIFGNVQLTLTKFGVHMVPSTSTRQRFSALAQNAQGIYDTTLMMWDRLKFLEPQQVTLRGQ